MQEYWSGLPCPPPGDLPDSGTEPVSLALTGEFFTAEPTPPRQCLPKWSQQIENLSMVSESSAEQRSSRIKLKTAPE